METVTSSAADALDFLRGRPCVGKYAGVAGNRPLTTSFLPDRWVVSRESCSWEKPRVPSRPTGPRGSPAIGGIVHGDDHDGALRVLTGAGFKTVSDESLVLRLRDEAGALARLAEKFKQAGANIRSLHILDRRNGHATVAISADDRARAEALVKPLTAVQAEGHEA